MNFTPEQLQAIETREKNLLVAAAAGSGKTAVLVERIIRQLEEGKEINRLLVVTFTKAAAAEMSERIGQRLEKAITEARENLGIQAAEREEQLKKIRHLEKQLILLPAANISTIHSFCQELIRRNVERLPDLDVHFRVADEQEVALLAQDVLEDYLENCYNTQNDEHGALLLLSEKYSTDRGDEQLCDMLQNLRQAAQNQPQPQHWLQGLPAAFDLPETAAIKDTIWWAPLQEKLQLETADLPRLLKNLRSQLDEVDNLLEGEKNCQEKKQKLADFWLDRKNKVLTLLETLKQGNWDSMRSIIQTKWLNKPAFIKKIAPEYSAAVDALHIAIKKKFEALQPVFLANEAELLDDVRQLRGTVSALAQLTIGYSKALDAKKREKNIIDFNDMEHFALKVLGEGKQGNFIPSSTALELRDFYQEIMVDEYQDTNKVQDTIFSLITGDTGKLFTVGDVKQSIYSFRAAEPSLFLDRYAAYQQPSALSQKLVCLTQNFRSRAEILAAVNFVFAQVMQRQTMEIDYDARAHLNKGLDYPVPDNGHVMDQNVEVLLVEKTRSNDGQNDDTAADQAEELHGFEAEARIVARRLKELKQSGVMVFDKDQDININHGYHEIHWRDMVVLLRSKSGKADVMLEALTSEGIPAYAEGSGGYFQAAEVKMMLALLSVIDNLQQDIPLAAVLASPVVGLRAAELAEIRLGLRNYQEDLQANAAEKAEAADEITAADFAAAVRVGAGENSMLRPELKQCLQNFLQQVADWRLLAREISVPELIWQLYRDTGYYDYVGGLPGGLLRQANLRMLVSRAEQYEKTDFRGLFRFLRFVEKLQNNDTDLSVARTLGEGEDVVRVMTIHKSKGLEFPVVVVADLGKGFYTRDLNGDFLLHKDLGVGLKQVDTERRVKYPSLPYLALREKKKMELKAEELRVLYVALTRAREKLILSGSISPLVTANGAPGSSKQRWGEAGSMTDQMLPPSTVATANSYLDWLLPAIARHPDSAKLREWLDIEQGGVDKLEAAAGSHWQMCLQQEKEILGNATENGENEILAAIKQGKLLPGGTPEEHLLVEQVLNWQYNLRGTEKVPSKLSVSELKRRFAAEGEDPATLLLPQLRQAGLPLEQAEKNERMAENNVLKKENQLREPSFHQAKHGLNGAAYGTLLHSVLQHVDLQGGLTAHGINRQLQHMVEQGIISETERKAVRLEQIAAFYHSNLGQRLLAAREVWRELPFCRLLPAKRFYPEVTDDKASIFSQGVIDLLFREKNGRLVLVDYKTDRDTTPEVVLSHYRLQLELYSEAIQTITGEQVQEKYLYMLRDGSIIPC